MQLLDPIADHFRLTGTQVRALSVLKLATIQDLLFHFPSRYENIADVKRIADLNEGDAAVIFGTLEKLETRRAWKSRRPIAEGYAVDESGRMKVIWFNQPYIAKMIPEQAPVKLTGKVAGSGSKRYLANPEVERLEGLPVNLHDSLFASTSLGESASLGESISPGEKSIVENPGSMFPVYPETQGITSRWFYHALDRIFKTNLHETLTDPLPEDLRDRYHLPSLGTALVWIHKPKREEDGTAARKRFSFEEVFYIQIAKQQDRRRRDEQPSFEIHVDRERLKEFTDRFAFSLTRAQQNAIEQVLKDFEEKHAMSRLLEGDVGSGKTAVAAATTYAVVTTKPKGKDFGRLQIAYMVPTEILAKQHFESFIQYFAHMPINIGLITSSGCRKFPSKVNPTEATDISRTQLLKWVANGEIPILIGTHALIQKAVTFKNLAYVIIDEQHRFGTAQRQMLVRKDNIAPHLLSMTATPIPRTLALTIYGDLDLSVLDEMPAGRKPVITETVYPKDREKAYEKIREELAAGRQAYVICPRIDEPDPEKAMAMYSKSVKEESARLKKAVFPEYEVGMLHGKMTPKEKDATMQRFLDNEINILVATSVIEVGVNVPNATVIILEGAERFGLAQLHQLRGRVIRSTHQAYCFVFAESKGKMTTARLRALKEAKNGFELAEHDLAIRGAGELYGRNQSGLSDMGMEALKNLKMVEAARTEAAEIVEKDPALSLHPDIKQIVETRASKLHFE